MTLGSTHSLLLLLDLITRAKTRSDGTKRSLIPISHPHVLLINDGELLVRSGGEGLFRSKDKGGRS